MSADAPKYRRVFVAVIEVETPNPTYDCSSMATWIDCALGTSANRHEADRGYRLVDSTVYAAFDALRQDMAEPRAKQEPLLRSIPMAIRHWWLRQSDAAACGADTGPSEATSTKPGAVTCARCLDFLMRNGCDGTKDGNHSWGSGPYCYCQRAKWGKTWRASERERKAVGS